MFIAVICGLLQTMVLNAQNAASAADIEIKLVAFDRASSQIAVGHYGIPGFSEARFPDLIFLVSNRSNEDISVSLDQCDFIDLKFPQPVRAKTFSARGGFGSTMITSLTGSVLIMPSGPSVLRVSPGQKKYISYGIGDVLAPSFESRQRGTSSCSFGVGDGNFLGPKVVPISSPGRYFQKN